MNDLVYAPPPFVNCNDQQVVFVDFAHARYELRFDAAERKASACSQITFKAETSGLPVVSMNQPVTSASLKPRSADSSQEHTVELKEQHSPDNKASFKVLSKPVTPGAYVLTIKSSLDVRGPYGRPVTWGADPVCVECIFNMSDRKRDNGYLEAFLPSNYCFDHFRISLTVAIENSSSPHSVYSNGAVSYSPSGQWRIEYPGFFNSSCPWFHLAPSDNYESLTTSFYSSDGRTIPILVYTKSDVDATNRLDAFAQYSKVIIRELESDFGPFPHGSLTVFAREEARFCGMEYAGATATDLACLRHELNHSYFSRSVMPVNGDAGWIDEAIAKWGDAGYPRNESEPDPVANMGRRSPYVRTTCDKAYSIGRDFLAHLDYVLHEQGGLKPFLKTYAKAKMHQSITTEEFQEMVEDFHGASLERLFDKCVYGQERNP